MFSLFFTITNNLLINTIITGFFTLVLSIINHFCYVFHGSPFTIGDIKNARTAADVVGSYDLSINSHILMMIIFFVIEICIAFFVSRKNKFSNRMHTVIVDLGLAIATFIVFFSPIAYIPSIFYVWSWSSTLQEYGYVNSFVVTTEMYFNYFPEPNNFDKDYEVKKCNQYAKTVTTDGNSPDVILILNESFYDLRQITDPATDIDFLRNIKSIDNSIQGYAINPIIGGHTNTSEYELLTCNSSLTMPGVTPFNTIDLTDSNSIVNHLESLGYSTVGAHCALASNYNRGVAYDALGFDTSYFVDDFDGLEEYDERYFYTDASAYDNLITWYENMPDAPRFMYFLTIQNHGDYNINPSSSDIVHTSKDYGEFADYVNEYLSCIYLSDLAFKELVDYYSNVDREVIIMMVGDHCPSFAPNIVDSNIPTEEANLRLRSIPFIIWSNTPTLLENYTVPAEAISMPYLVPTLLETAGVKLSGYYDYLITQRQLFPVLTQDNMPKELIDIEYLNVKYPTLSPAFFD